MKLNLKGEILDIYGDPIIDIAAKERLIAKMKKTGGDIESMSEPPLTLRTVCMNALYGNYEDEQKLPGEEKLQRHLIAQRILLADDTVDISIDEIVLIRRLIGKAFTVLVAGQALDMLEKNSEK